MVLITQWTFDYRLKYSRLQVQNFRPKNAIFDRKTDFQKKILEYVRFVKKYFSSISLKKSNEMEQEKSNTNSTRESNVSKKYSKTSLISKTISKTSLIHKVGFHIITIY